MTYEFKEARLSTTPFLSESFGYTLLMIFLAFSLGKFAADLETKSKMTHRITSGINCHQAFAANVIQNHPDLLQHLRRMSRAMAVWARTCLLIDFKAFHFLILLESDAHLRSSSNAGLDHMPTYYGGLF